MVSIKIQFIGISEISPINRNLQSMTESVGTAVAINNQCLDCPCLLVWCTPPGSPVDDYSAHNTPVVSCHAIWLRK